MGDGSIQPGNISLRTRKSSNSDLDVLDLRLWSALLFITQGSIFEGLQWEVIGETYKFNPMNSHGNPTGTS